MQVTRYSQESEFEETCFGNVLKIEEINTYRILIQESLEKRTLGKVKKILNRTLVLKAKRL
jgi:hypothetical protein